MEETTVEDAARTFRVLLDRVERDGVSFRIVRHGNAVAMLGPARHSTAGALRERLRVAPPDEALWRDISFVRTIGARQRTLT